MGLEDLMSAAKAFNLTDDQKQAVKKVVKEAAGNKATIVAEVNKLGIKISEDQVDMVTKLVDKL